MIGIEVDIKSHAARDEWVVILGGAGSVGQYAIQVRINEPTRSGEKTDTPKGGQALRLQSYHNLLPQK
jgi:hypothetical protein